MNLSQLEAELKETLSNFKNEGEARRNNNKSDELLKESDYDELSRQVFYVLEDYKKNIIKYLGTLEKSL